MGVTVLAPPPLVIVPGRSEPMALFPAPGRAVTAPEIVPVVYRPPTPRRPEPPLRWRVAYAEPEVEVPGRAAPMPMTTAAPPAPSPVVYAATGFATSVALVPAGGTNVTSTAANLMIGPITYIADFTIHALDAGTFIMWHDWPRLDAGAWV